MATFRKRGENWFAEVSVRGKRAGKTHSTKAKAKSWAAEKEIELSLLADGVSVNHTLGDVFERYSEEISSAKKGARWELVRLNKFSTYDIARIKLVDLRREHLEDWVRLRLTSVKPSSVNRELNLVSHCLTQARRWRLMNHNPMADLKRPKNPPHRDRLISESEQQALLIALNYSEGFPVTLQKQRVAVAMQLAIETAMRAGEICSITPENVNLENRTVYLPTTKNGLPRYVPLSARAVELLEMLKPWGDTVFRVDASTLSTMFTAAVKKADIDNLVFHDTRHEAVTRLAQKLDILDLARVTGHTDIKQLKTYYNKSAADIAKLL